MNYLKVFILAFAVAFTLTAGAQTEAEKQALEGQVAELMLEKSAAEATFREQIVLKSKIDSFLIFHQLTVEEIAKNLNAVVDLQNQIDTALATDKKTLNAISLWLEATLTYSRSHSYTMLERNKIETQRFDYERSCRDLATKKLLADSSNLLAKTTELISIHRNRAAFASESSGATPELQAEIKARIQDMVQLELSANQIKASLQANDKESEVCVLVRDLTRIIDIMEIYNSVAIFLNTDGLSAINKDISSFLLSLDKDIQDSEKITFTRRYLVSLKATFEDYHRRGLIEKMNNLGNRLPAVSQFLRSQTKFINNESDRLDVETEIAKEIAAINSKHSVSISDLEDLNAILYRRVRYLLAKAIQANAKKPLSLVATNTLAAVGIDMTTKKIAFANKKDFNEVMSLCNDLAIAEELMIKE